MPCNKEKAGMAGKLWHHTPCLTNHASDASVKNNITMKKLFVFAAIAAFLTSCTSLAPTTTIPNTKFICTATHTQVNVVNPVTALVADLEVSPDKISYSYVPSRAVRNGGFDNIVNCAVQEALRENGDADVMVALEQQVKYNDSGECESITVTGYPAKYKNFRNPGDNYAIEMSKSPAQGETQAKPAATGLGLGLKLK